MVIRPVPAEAFLDPGADATIVSLRWIAEHAPADECPIVDHAHQILDHVSVEIGQQILTVPSGARIQRQGDPPARWTKSKLWQDSLVMPGYEDILLGRDFLRANDLLLLADFTEGWFSLLHPHAAMLPSL